MKKTFLAVLMVLLCFNSITVLAADNNPAVPKMTEERYTQMKKRVEEIRKMDKSNLSKEERKDLRRELKDMNKEAKANGKSGIYISVSALIIIILVLLLIL